MCAMQNTEEPLFYFLLLRSQLLQSQYFGSKKSCALYASVVTAMAIKCINFSGIKCGVKGKNMASPGNLILS